MATVLVMVTPGRRAMSRETAITEGWQEGRGVADRVWSLQCGEDDKVR
jgi:hypothetical protein